MRSRFIALSVAFLATSSLLVPNTFATVDDSRLSELENGSGTTTSAPNFSLKKFDNCGTLRDTMVDFIDSYYRNNPSYQYRYEDSNLGEMFGWVTLEWSSSPGAVKAEPQAIGTNSVSDAKTATDFSSTNIQIGGVDESEIVKTDGRYSYFYNSTDRKIYITDGMATGKPEVVRKISLPEMYNNPEMYVGSGKLVLLATKYSQYSGNMPYWFNWSTKTVVVVYDLSDIKTMRIDRYFQVDGNLTNSRRVGNKLYVLSSSQLNFPYSRYYAKPLAASSPATLNSTKLNDEFSTSNIIPKAIELRYMAKTGNYSSNGKQLPYNITSGQATSCSDISYILPDAKTMEKYQFSPTLTTLTAIDLDNSAAPAKTQAIFGDTSEIMMTKDSLYLTSRLYSPSNMSCPWYARCFAPYFGNEQTLIHKMDISGLTATYKATAVVPGSPLNQYSMDEGPNGEFRIVTQESGNYDSVTNSTNQSSRLSIFASDLAPLGTLAGIGKNENFQSSRFIGNRLYLVTFKQIDPLFVIDLKDPKNPTILGELKIPGYSTYLHPYDDTKLIGLGYDTKTNKWGGTMNNGIKVDLYDVADVANPKQLATKTFGNYGSTSDALNNPRLFVWNKARGLLFLPATLMYSTNNADDPYAVSDVFQGALTISISPTGIEEKSRITHIDSSNIAALRAKDCQAYSGSTSQTKCEKLISGGEYCPSAQSYVPPYCYASASDGAYLASHIWSWNDSFIIRSLYFDRYFYTFSGKKLIATDLDANNASVAEMPWKK